MKNDSNTWNPSIALAIVSAISLLVGMNGLGILAKTRLSSAPITSALRKFVSVRTLDAHSSWVYALAISPVGQTLASGGYDGTIQLWDMPTGELLRTLSAHADAIESLAISPDGQLLASASWDNQIKLWRLETGELVDTLSGHEDDVKALAFSPNGDMLASGGADRRLKLWSLQTGEEVNTMSETAWVRSVAFSPDGRLLASGGEDGSVKIWQLGDQRGSAHVLPVQTLGGHARAVWSVAFSPIYKGSQESEALPSAAVPVDVGYTLASSSADGEIQLWSLPQGERLHSIVGHTRGVRSVAFSPDGQMLASGGYDRAIKLWNTGTGQLFGQLSGHAKSVWSVAFSPDGQTLASGSSDATLKLWSVPERGGLEEAVGEAVSRRTATP